MAQTLSVPILFSIQCIYADEEMKHDTDTRLMRDCEKTTARS